MKQEPYAYSLCSAQLKAPLPKPIVISLVGGGGKTSCIFWLARQFSKNGHSVFVSTTTKMYFPEKEQADNFIFLDRDPYHQIIDKYNLFSDPGVTFGYKNIINSNNINQKNKVLGVTTKLIDKLKNDSPFTVFIIEADGANQLPIKAPNGHEPCIPQSSDMVIGVTGAEAIHTQASPERIHRWDTFSALTLCSEGDLIDLKVLRNLIEHRQGMFKNAPEKAVKVWLINKIDLANSYQDIVLLANQIMATSTKLDAIWIASMKNQIPIKDVLMRG